MKFNDIRAIGESFRTHSPLGLLVLMQMAMFLSFAAWQVLIQNFAYQGAGLDGAQYGILQSVREIPGFLAFLVVYITIYIHEQKLAYLSLILLGVFTALTGYLPSFGGILLTTLMTSIGFHYYETVNQSLQLQLLEKDTAPQNIGRIAAAGSFVSFLVYGGITLLWKPLGLSFSTIYVPLGIGTVLAMIYLMIRYPLFEGQAVQSPGIILKKRYWLFYALQFFSGARRQIFVVFAGFMMVERFHFGVDAMAAMALATFLLTSVIAPFIGRLIQAIGERKTLIIEYIGLFVIFSSYVAIFIWDLSSTVAVFLYIVDYLFFAMAIAMKTYFQKIASPEDLRSSAAVSFTINHIAAVVLPASLGLIWIISPVYVFAFAAFLSLCSLGCAFLVPINPQAGNETRLKEIRP